MTKKQYRGQDIPNATHQSALPRGYRVVINGPHTLVGMRIEGEGKDARVTAVTGLRTRHSDRRDYRK